MFKLKKQYKENNTIKQKKNFKNIKNNIKAKFTI
jgi:hypothetical protein